MSPVTGLDRRRELQEVKAPRFRDNGTGLWQVVSLTHRPPLLQGNTPGTHFCQRLSRSQGHSAIGRILCQRKIPMTPAGIEPATFRFVAQNLSHCATAVPGGNNVGKICLKLCEKLCIKKKNVISYKCNNSGRQIQISVHSAAACRSPVTGESKFSQMCYC